MVGSRGSARRACKCVALASLLLLGCSTWSLAAATRQKSFSISLQDNNDLYSTPSPSSSDRFPVVHLSHSGVYLSSPISRNAPQYLTFSVDSSLYDIESVKVTIGRSKQRNWEQTHLECGGLDAVGIEACEKDDLKEIETTTIAQKCEPYKIIPSQSRVLINTDSCPSLNSLLSVSVQSNVHETYLDSVTLSFEIQRVFPTRREKHSYWIGKIVRKTGKVKDGGALWPYAVKNKDDEGNTFALPEWTGRLPNTISEQMQDPYMPKSYKAEATDVLNGVDLIDSTWSYGISILSPTNGNVSKPTDRKWEAIHAPISGQIVWMGTYNLPRAPGNHRNDENGYALMIRDEWGFVYQLLGLDETQVYVKLGEIIEAGHIIGSSSRTPLSQEPPCRHKPADPPEMYDNSRRYPHRNRVLRIRVSRPDPSWKDWKGPSETGWQYFNPLDTFTTEQFTSHVPPDVNPRQLYFARPSEDGGLTPPSIFATTKDLFQPPVLSGNVEIIVGFDSFISTPDNVGGKLDPTSLHALDWAVWPKADSSSSSSKEKRTADIQDDCAKPEGIEWRTAFDHAKLPNQWSITLVKNALLAHYVPAFLVGTIPFFKTKYASSFDEKDRKLYYAPTRTVVGLPDGRGYWNTLKEPSGNGMYEVWVRGRDWFGNVGCFGANVQIKNS